MPAQLDLAEFFDGYDNGNETKLTIIRAAATMFARQGYTGSSLRAIARSAGVDHTTLLYHFGSKERLLVAALQWRDRVPIETLEEMPPPETLAASIAANARSAMADPEMVQFFNVMSAEAGIADHPAREYLQRRHALLVELFASAVTAQRAAGKVPPNGLSVEETAELIISSWEGLQVNSLLHPDTVDVGRLLGALLSQNLGMDVPATPA